MVQNSNAIVIFTDISESGMKVSDILAIYVSIKQQSLLVLKLTKILYMKVSDTLVIYVIINHLNSVALRNIKKLFMKVSDIFVICVIIKQNI